MDVILTPGDPRSMVVQIYEQLRDAIADGLLPPGYRLTPSRVLAGELGISRATVANAYGRLVAEGYAHGRRGGGTVIDATPAPPTVPDDNVTAVHPTPQATRLQRYGTGVVTEVRYDMTPGRVDANLFPLPAWRRCVRASLTDKSALAAYGDLAGSRELRKELARWIAQSRGIAASPDQIIVTQGATQALDLLARTLLIPGDIAAVEEPGYPPAATNLESHGINVAGVPVNRNGLAVDQLPAGTRLVYVTPSHQYPLGHVLARRRRLALLQWATTNDAVIIEDDYDSEFRHGQRPLEPLHRLDQTGRVVYIGTFSKVLSPTLRLGFMVAPRPLVPSLLAIRQATDFGSPHLIDAAMTAFIAEGHLHRHLRRARRVYTERHTRLRQELRSQAPKTVTVLPGHAGLHLTLLVPDAPADYQIASRAAERGLFVSSLRRTYRTSDPQPGVIIGFGALATGDIPDAVRLLVDSLAP